MRRACGQAEGGAASEREPDDRSARDAERVEEAGKIANKMRRRIILGIGRGVGAAVAALVIGDDAETAAQGARLVKPHALAAGEAVDKDHRLAGADIVERDCEITDLDFIHCLLALDPSR